MTASVIGNATVAIALAGVGAMGGIAATAEAGEPAKRIYAHYMPWYETPGFRGYWGNHWTGFNNEADPNTIVGPDGRRDI